MEMEFKYRDNKEQSRIYDEEYAKGKYGNRKNRAVRHGLHYDWISARIEKTDDVLVTSCGRGELVRMFLENGFHSVGTEISDWVIENHLQDIECFKLHYSELGTLANNRYDVIVSNDVLEHLNNKRRLAMRSKNLHASPKNTSPSPSASAQNHNSFIRLLNRLSGGES